MIYLKKDKDLEINEIFETKEHIYVAIHDWEFCTFCNNCNKEIYIDDYMLKDIINNCDFETTKILCENCSKERKSKLR